MTATREKTKDEDALDETNGHEDLSPGVTPGEMDNDPSIRRVRYRGVLYVLHEPEIGTFDDIVKKTTREEPDPVTGGTREIVDSIMRQRLLLRAMLKEGMPSNGLSGIPPRVMFHLNGVVSEMLFGDEVDELEAERKKKAEEDTVKGNA